VSMKNSAPSKMLRNVVDAGTYANQTYKFSTMEIVTHCQIFSVFLDRHVCEPSYREVFNLA